MKYASFIALLSLVFFSQFVLTESIAARGDGANVSGKLLKSNGKPLAYTEIELVPVDAETQINDARLLSTTSAVGAFNFKNIPDGEYTLSINFDEKPSGTSPYATFFYPTATKREDAKILKIEAATKINNLIFSLPPPLVQRRITGTVIGIDGSPVANAFVVLKDFEYEDRSVSVNAVTDRSGKFTLNGFETRRYAIAAVLLDRLPTPSTPPGDPIAVGKTQPFTLDAANSNFTIVLRKIGEEDRVPDGDIGMLISED